MAKNDAIIDEIQLTLYQTKSGKCYVKDSLDDKMDIFSLVRLMIALGAWFRQVNVLGADDYIDIITAKL